MRRWGGVIYFCQGFLPSMMPSMDGWRDKWMDERVTWWKASLKMTTTSFTICNMYTFESVLITGSHSCENQRSVLHAAILTINRVNRFSLWESIWELSLELGQNSKIAQHWFKP
jgi:hypothetical protein